eukprot:gene1455-12074_t
MFKLKMEDSNSSEYILEVENEKIGMDLLNFIYSEDQLIINNENAINLLVVSTFFEITTLKEECEFYLKNALDFENVLILYEISNDYSSYYLRNECINYFTSNFNDIIILNSWKNLDEEVKSYLRKVSGKREPKQEIKQESKEIILEEVIDDSGDSKVFSLFASKSKEDKQCIIS